MKTIVFVCVALVVLAASEARPPAPEEGSPSPASGGKGLSQATSLGVGKHAATYSETGAKNGISYGATGASADTGIAMSKSQSQYEN